jgi:hypothetical protein
MWPSAIEIIPGTLLRTWGTRRLASTGMIILERLQLTVYRIARFDQRATDIDLLYI